MINQNTLTSVGMKSNELLLQLIVNNKKCNVVDININEDIGSKYKNTFQTFSVMIVLKKLTIRINTHYITIKAFLVNNMKKNI